MAEPKKAIILLEALNKPEDLDYQSPLLRSLGTLQAKDITLFNIDSHSNSLLVNYAKELIDRSEEVFLICDFQQASSPGSLQMVLNHVVKKSNVHLLTLGTSDRIAPFLKMMKGKSFDHRTALQDYLQTLVHQG